MKKLITLKRIDIACSSDDFRPAMSYIQVLPNGRATATNGHILISLADIEDVEVNTMKTVLIPRKTWTLLATSYKPMTMKISDEKITADIADIGVVEFPVVVDGAEKELTYPNWSTLLSRISFEEAKQSAVSFNLNLLHDIQRATAWKNVVMMNSSADKFKQRIVMPATGSEFEKAEDASFAVLMPVYADLNDVMHSANQTFSTIKNLKYFEKKLID